MSYGVKSEYLELKMLIGLKDCGITTMLSWHCTQVGQVLVFIVENTSNAGWIEFGQFISRQSGADCRNLVRKP